MTLHEQYPHIKLHLILPCEKADQTAKWTAIQIVDNDKILFAANDVEYLASRYYNGCKKVRNARIVELADCCVCYYDDKESASGTGQTVRMAERKGIYIIRSCLYNSGTHLFSKN